MEQTSQAVVGPLERTVRPAAWIQHHKAGDNLEWEDPGGKRTALYDEQTLWNSCARAGELERDKARADAERIRAAAAAVVRVWNSPSWNWSHTGSAADAMNALAAALGPNLELTGPAGPKE